MSVLHRFVDSKYCGEMLFAPCQACATAASLGSAGVAAVRHPQAMTCKTQAARGASSGLSDQEAQRRRPAYQLLHLTVAPALNG